MDYNQILPINGWSRAIAMAGRGWGKTRVGAGWSRRNVGMNPGITGHVIAPTYGDLRGVIFNGVSGLLDALPSAMVYRVNHSTFEISGVNGFTIRGFSSESPDRLRGPQCTWVWGDELASWQNAEEMLSNIDFSTRIAWKTKHATIIQPQRFYTTTPRPLAWLAKMIAKDTMVIRGTTYENRDNLAEAFFKEVEQYEGTAIGRQELQGELLDISEAAIIKKSWLQKWPFGEPWPWFEFVMVSMDTAFTEKTYDKKKFEADPTACTVWGVFKKDRRWNLLLLDAWDDYLGFPALVKQAQEEMKTVYGRKLNTFFKPMYGQAHVHEQRKKPDLLIIEEKGSGISLRQMLANEGIDSYPYNPGQADKLGRLHAVSHLPFNKRIWIPESAKRPGEFVSWATRYLDELCIYAGPGTTKHDDFIDSTTQAWRVFSDNFMADGSNALIPESAPVGTVGHPLVQEHVIPAVQRPRPTDDDRDRDNGDFRFGEREAAPYG